MQHDGPRQDVVPPGRQRAERFIQAFEAEVDYLFASLRRLGARPAEIEDLVQEVFLELLRSRRRLGRRDALRGRLFGLAVGVMARHRRRDGGAPAETIPPESVGSMPLVLAALDRVPLKHRAVLVMHELDQAPTAKIASSLAMTRWGVARRLRKARREMDIAVREIAAEWRAGRFGRATALLAALGMADDQEVRAQAANGLLELRDDVLLLEMVMDDLHETIYFKDRESRFTHINRHAAAHYGIINPALAVGRTDFDFFTDEHAYQALRDEQQIIATGEPLVSVEEQETLPGGKSRRVRTTKLPLLDPGGVIVGTFGLSRDITERRAG